MRRLVTSAYLLLASATLQAQEIQTVDWEFEISNEAYVQTGLNEDEFPSWTLVDLELYAENSFALSENVKLISGLSIGAGYDANEKEGEIEEYYIGIDYDGYRFGLGSKEYASEEFDISLEINFGRQTDFEQIQDQGERVLYFQTERESYELGLSADFSADQRSYDAFLSVELGENTTLATAYQRYRELGDENYTTTLGATLINSIGDWEFISSLSGNQFTTSIDLGVEREFAAGHKFALSCGVENLKQSKRDRNTLCFTNFAYKVSDYLFLNAELGYLETEDADGVGFLLGVEFEYE